MIEESVIKGLPEAVQAQIRAAAEAERVKREHRHHKEEEAQQAEWEAEDKALAEAENPKTSARRLSALLRSSRDMTFTGDIMAAVAEHRNATPRAIWWILSQRDFDAPESIWNNPNRHGWPRALRVAVERACDAVPRRSAVRSFRQRRRCR